MVSRCVPARLPRSGRPWGHGTRVPAVRYTGTYAVLLSLHLLAVVFVVGPLTTSWAVAARLAEGGTSDVGALRRLHRSTRVLSAASVVAVLLGAAMVGPEFEGAPRWEWGDLWVSASLVLWLVAVLLLVLVVARAEAAAVAALERGADGSRYAGRIRLGGGLASLAFAVVVVLMVVKPGA